LASTVGLALQDAGIEINVPVAPHHRRQHKRRPRYQVAIASWYGYGGAVDGACGQLQADGVANKTLPCWTRLVICATRCAGAVVDDRGPFVPGRDFDLSLSLAQAIGFDFYAGVTPVRWRLGRR